MTDNKRLFQRIALEGTATITVRDLSAQVPLLDLSLKGALTVRPANWSLGPDDSCRLSIRLSGAETPIVMDAQVAHIEAERIGFRCTSIDIDSISFLRRLVELNAGDPAILERELSALG